MQGRHPDCHMGSREPRDGCADGRGWTWEAGGQDVGCCLVQGSGTEDRPRAARVSGLAAFEGDTVLSWCLCHHLPALYSLGHSFQGLARPGSPARCSARPGYLCHDPGLCASVLSHRPLGRGLGLGFHSLSQDLMPLPGPAAPVLFPPPFLGPAPPWTRLQV